MSVRPAKILWIAFTLWAGWYFIASGYDYGDLAGTYTYQADGVACELQLNKDRSFEQVLVANNKTERAAGEWHRMGESGVSFSSGLLRIPNSMTFIQVQPGQGDGTQAADHFYGHFERVFGLFPELYLEGGPSDLILKKRYF